MIGLSDRDKACLLQARHIALANPQVIDRDHDNPFADAILGFASLV
ncbi:hypothetical protein ABVV53_13455 [Novosphingobium sp. RD2P27]|uniref:Uncharacterized protein n=1 Tax=Novosphingobium kalidii TaxID=3230299 RepID=A0ABV2D3K2_9SPHN